MKNKFPYTHDPFYFSVTTKKIMRIVLVELWIYPYCNRIVKDLDFSINGNLF